MEHVLVERSVEGVELQERLNFQSFKYQLLVDMASILPQCDLMSLAVPVFEAAYVCEDRKMADIKLS